MEVNLDYWISLLTSCLRIAVPIAFAAIGALLCERAGIVNIGIEGMMLTGAFAGVYGSYITGSAYGGLLIAMIGGGLVGLLHAVLTIAFKTDHIISGLGINLLAQGLTVVLLMTIWDSKGKSPDVEGFTNLSIPLIKDIPFIGPIIGNMNILFYLLIAVVIVTWIVLFKTVFGLRVRVIGENPQVADTLGVHVYKMQYICVILCGVLAGIGGACLSIGDVHFFNRDMVAGRGYIALAAMIFGGWNPVGAFGSSMLFGLAQSLQIRLQVFDIPVQFVQMLPYILTIVVLVVYRNRNRAPAASGKHFRRGET
ncbi:MULTISPECIES: ABC transporter permease [Cohnella]|uniref:ABC transporter permease n=1 Tax=Cohnella TaxID=329857 RepID=UPI0009B98C45|nr:MULTISPECIES: ABC transporter permease [Cohnella]MBN2979806.1 ABC transporter permease [Cohnella algarum]